MPNITTNHAITYTNKSLSTYMVQCCPILSPHTGRDLVDSAHAKTLFKRNNSTLVFFGSTSFPVKFK